MNKHKATLELPANWSSTFRLPWPPTNLVWPPTLMSSHTKLYRDQVDKALAEQEVPRTKLAVPLGISIMEMVPKDWDGCCATLQGILDTLRSVGVVEHIRYFRQLHMYIGDARQHPYLAVRMWKLRAFDPGLPHP